MNPKKEQEKQEQREKPEKQEKPKGKGKEQAAQKPLTLVAKNLEEADLLRTAIQGQIEEVKRHAKILKAYGCFEQAVNRADDLVAVYRRIDRRLHDIIKEATGEARQAAQPGEGAEAGRA